MSNINDVRKVTRGFQITIPQGFRERNNIKEGDLIEVSFKGSKLTIEPVSIKKKDPLSNLKDLFASKPKNKVFDNKSEKEVMKIVNKEIQLSRKKK